jgi:hypothetical protein
MSLRIEQKLDDFYFTESEPRIYTTGAYLVPMKVKISNKEGYVWVLDEFVDDTFICLTGKDCSPAVLAKSKEEIFNKLEE